MTKQHEHILQSIAIATIILLLSFVVSVLPAHASTFPSDAQSGHFEQLANGSWNILATTTARTVLAFQLDIKTGSASQVGIYCADKGAQVDTVNDIFETHQGNVSQILSVAHCNNKPISMKITGDTGQGEHAYLVWVDRDTSITRDPMELGQSVATSTFVNGSFSATTTAVIANSSSTPLYVQDAGNVLFLLTILLCLMFLMVVGFVYNNMTNKKPWH